MLKHSQTCALWKALLKLRFQIGNEGLATSLNRNQSIGFAKRKVPNKLEVLHTIQQCQSDGTAESLAHSARSMQLRALH